MAEAGSNEARHLPVSAAGRRSTPNVSSAWVIMLLAGLVAAVIFLYATQQSSKRISVAVINKTMQPGEKLDASTLGQAQISADQAQLDKLVLYADRNNYNGKTAAGPLQSGDFLRKSEFRDNAANDGKRAMSVPLKQSRAVNGAISVGDRVDVIAHLANTPPYIATDLEVLSVNTPSSSGALGSGSSEFSVTVAVDSDQAVLISAAIDDGKFDIIRSTGSTPIDTSSGSAATTATSGSSGASG